MEILKFPHPSLLTLAEPVKEFGEALAKTLEEMFVLMKASKAVGLAANQVGINQRMFVMEGSKGEKLFFVNPEIAAFSVVLSPFKEGCLSAPGDFVKLPRSSWVIVKFWNEKGEEKSLEFDGIQAVCVQHEMDHLDGKVFLQNIALASKKRKYFRKKWGLK